MDGAMRFNDRVEAGQRLALDLFPQLTDEEVVAVMQHSATAG